MPQTRLTPEQAAELHTLQTVVQEIKLDIERAKRAGLDMSAHEARLAEVEHLRQGVLREFSPGVTRPVVRTH